MAEPTPAEINTFKRLTSRKERLWRKIQDCHDLIPNLPQSLTNFKVRVAQIDAVRAEFTQTLDEIDDLSNNYDQFKTNTTEIESALDRLYYDILEAASKHSQPTNTDRDQTSNVPRKQLTLPEVKIPKFDGRPEKFPAFIALYDNLIHNTNLSDIEKFSYLLTYLEKSALKYAQTVRFSPENYNVVYNLLVQRYTNKRIIANYYLSAIFNTSPLKTDSSHLLTECCEVLQANVTALIDLKLPNLADYIFLQFSLRLLDSKTREAFEKEFLDTEFPVFDDLMKFLRSKCSIAEIIGSTVNKNAPRSEFSKFDVRVTDGKRISMTVQENLPTQDSPQRKINANCPACSRQGHNLSSCQHFLSLTPIKRHELVKNSHRCYACLFPHPVARCPSTARCRHCGSNRHNTLLHQTSFSGRAPTSDTATVNATVSPTIATDTPSTSVASMCASMQRSIALLGTAKALIYSSDLSLHECRVVLDSGSQSNFITSSLADKLGLFRRRCPYEIHGVGQSQVNRVLGMVDCKLRSSYSDELKFNFQAAVLSRITADLPTVSLPSDVKNRFQHLQLADPNFDVAAPIDMLLGVQAVLDITPDQPLVIKGEPSACLTSLGWVIMGNIPASNTCISNSLFSDITFDTELSLNETLRAFWQSEEISLPSPISPEDEYCESYYKETTERNDFGQYIVKLPLKKEKFCLESTRHIAFNRFKKLEQRFKHDPEFYRLYSENIKDYIDQGHLTLSSSPSEYVITHHGVFKRGEERSRVRVVFNPTERDNKGFGLNDLLYSGPKLQADIGVIITRFRIHPVALTCDIKQMFRSIIVHPDDRKLLHIFWRFHPNEPLQEWEHTRVIFGATSSPFLALRTMIQLVEDEGHNYPEAALALRNSTYVDDILSGADTIEEAISLKNQLIAMLKQGGFELAKWASSSSDVVESSKQRNLPIGDRFPLQPVKVLGLCWNPENDYFYYNIPELLDGATKRCILSRVARTFDINGYLSPFTFLLKSLIQKLWLLKVDWDDPLPPEIARKWDIIQNEITYLKEIKIPKCIWRTNGFQARLFGFSDASELGMAAVIYLQLQINNTCKVSLIAAKSKVAPLKLQTIPKLELGAASLLSKLMHHTMNALEFLPIMNEIICFVDSTTVINWIRTPPYRLKTFVANRVVQIHENLPNAKWYHIPGESNPADPASRGLLPSELLHCGLWWNGPTFLHNPNDIPRNEVNTPTNLPEMKNSTQVSLTIKTMYLPFVNILERTSNFLKVQRIFAYVLRFIHNCLARKRNKDFLLGSLTAEDYHQGLITAIKTTQLQYLSNDISAIERNSPASKKYRQLSPFLSQEGLLMVGGRLRNSNLPTRAKHPYFIPYESRLATLICDHYHLYSGHGGPRLTQSLINREYWIPSIRRLIRSRIFHCSICYRFKAQPVHPPMADLPNYRLEPGRCFAHTGVDFGGPFEVKTSCLRNARYEKSYICLFVCMVSRAVHIEVTTSLTTNAFLACLDRFIARRGLPSHLYSDQGRNFRGAAREVSEITNFLNNNQPDITDYLAKRQISWSFNPPYAPHFGGLWEAGIKSAKYHLKSIMHNRRFTLEEFLTVMTRIEGILNSRPFCAPSATPEDLDPLTPGHFLIGGPILSRPEVDLSNVPENRQTRWQLVQQITNSFWKRWARDYLHTLQHRPKWTQSIDPPNVGDVVLWYAPNTPPTHWPMGRILELIRGQDGVVRVLRLRTAKGELIRPLNKVVLLPKN